jgi:hypothetical protein
MNIKDNLIKLIKGNPMAVLAAAIAVVAFIAYIIIFTPMIKEIKKKYLECRRCESEVINAHNIIEYAKTVGKSYGCRVLISEKEAATGIEEFTEHAKELDVNFLSLKPQNIITKEGVPYKIMPIELELEAPDKQFVDFLGSIDELKKAIVTVENFDITPDLNDHAKLHAKMVVDIYLSTREDTP